VNLASAAVAKSQGAEYVFAHVSLMDLLDAAESDDFDAIGVDAAVSPRLSAVSAFLECSSDVDPAEMALLHQAGARVVLVDLDPDDALAGKRLADANLPRGIVVGAIIRDGASIVPRGPERIEAGDSVVIFGTSNAASELSEFV